MVHAHLARMTKPAAPTHAISIRQPWAWLIAHGFKDVENRDWATNFRGAVYLHASLYRDRDDYEAAVAFVREIDPELADRIPSFETIERGGIVGQADLVDCVPESDSQWFVGDFGFVMKDATSCTLIPCRGALKFFKPAI